MIKAVVSLMCGVLVALAVSSSSTATAAEPKMDPVAKENWFFRYFSGRVAAG